MSIMSRDDSGLPLESHCDRTPSARARLAAASRALAAPISLAVVHDLPRPGRLGMQVVVIGSQREELAQDVERKTLSIAALVDEEVIDVAPQRNSGSCPEHRQEVGDPGELRQQGIGDDVRRQARRPVDRGPEEAVDRLARTLLGPSPRRSGTWTTPTAADLAPGVHGSALNATSLSGTRSVRR